MRKALIEQSAGDRCRLVRLVSRLYKRVQSVDFSFTTRTNEIHTSDTRAFCLKWFHSLPIAGKHVVVFCAFVVVRCL